jgi:hypothetical protein
VSNAKKILAGMRRNARNWRMEDLEVVAHRFGVDVPVTAAAASFASLPWKEARERYLESFERSYAQALLTRCDGNVSFGGS